ncbi:ABC transporter permease [Clostridiales bacterium COT073_COT-073]|nr:ABC transporter permease [Clostridiales bacterium COT073_COT-073]
MSVKKKIALSEKSKSFFSQYMGQLVFFAVIFVLLSFSSKTFLTGQNLLNVSRQISTNMIVSCAMTMILITGGIDLSIGAVMALAGMISGYLSLAGVPFSICLLLSLLAGMTAGLVNGAILAYTDLPPFIVTYSVQSILRGMVYVITTAGTLRLTDKNFLTFGGGSLGFLPWPVIYMIVVMLGSYLILNKTKMGRHIYAIGGNPKAAAFAGINSRKIKLFIYALSGTLAALAGLVYTSRNTSMQPSLGTGVEMDAIAAVVLGGTSMAGGQGGIFGTIIGAVIIGIINNGLNLMRMDSFWQYIAKGIVILIAVYADYIKKQRLLKMVGK